MITTIEMPSGYSITVCYTHKLQKGTRIDPPIDEVHIHKLFSDKGRIVSMEAIAKHEGYSIDYIEGLIEEQIMEESVMEQYIDY